MKIVPFKLERYFARYEFNVPYLLCSSDCEAMSVQDLLAMQPGAGERFGQLWLGYTESDGSTELRQAITALYQQISPDQLLVCAGAEEGIFLFMNALLDKGDHIIVHTPCYQSLLEVARAVGCDVTEWHTDAAHDWELDFDNLNRNIRPTTKAIIVNCPHNPTGYLMSRDKQQQIVEIARAHGLLLFSDEVYRCLEHDPLDTLPAACDLYENAVSLGVMSKTYGLAGLRIGWIATRNQAARAAMASFKDYTSICNSAPSEFLAVIALQHRDQIAERNLAIIRRNLGVLDDFFARHTDRFDWQRPRAGSTAFPLLKGDQDVEAFCDDLVRRKGVMLLPGTCYEAGSQHFRVGFGRANLPECVAVFEDYLKDSV
jgi:aspartate/methionine/tyrosine aminotransferase